MTDDEKKAAVQAERDAIKVTNLANTKNEDKASQKADASDTDTEKNEEVTEAKAVEEVTEETTTEGSEETETESDEEEKSEDVKRLEAQLEKERQKFEKRINKKTAESKEQANKIAELEKLLASKSAENAETMTKEEAEQLAEEKAQQKILEREYSNACDRLAEAAKKIDKDFDTKIKQLSGDVAPLPHYMIPILDDLDNGGALLNYFIANPEEYEDIIALSAVKMAVNLAKLSAKIETEAKPKPKPQSKVPSPINPVGGKGGTNNTILTEADTKDMATFVKKRQAQIEQRRKAGHYNAR